MSTVRVLSLSTVFPRPAEENLGIFVRSRLERVAQLLTVKVVAPAPLFDYAARGGKKTPPLPPQRQDENLEVFYPRWFYPPYGGVLNAWFLAARLLPFLRR